MLFFGADGTGSLGLKIFLSNLFFTTCPSDEGYKKENLGSLVVMLTNTLVFNSIQFKGELSDNFKSPAPKQNWRFIFFNLCTYRPVTGRTV